MGLHDRLKTSNGAGGLATAELLTNGSTPEPSGPTVRFQFSTTPAGTSWPRW